MSKTGIVLIGMAGVGKSTIGLSLAQSLGVEFIDLDDYLRYKEGKTIQQIIDSQGEAALLELEERSMHEIDLRHKVVAPGGSIIYMPELMEPLKQSAYLVYLDDDFENIEKRLKNVTDRGIVGLRNKSLQDIYNERLPLYTRYADIKIDVRGKLRDEVVSEILEHIQQMR